MKYSGEIVDLKGSHIVRSTNRKDRHSKVCTAKGTRDRRVRLSALTAIQFYDLQDRLGYDRPSKAVDWLMKHAKSAIDELELISPVPIKTPLPVSDASGSGPFAFAAAAAAPSSPKDLRLSLQSLQDGNFGHQNAAFLPNSDSAGLSELNQRMALRNAVVFGQGQIFTQREPLQSSNLSLFRPWMENMDHEMLNPSASSIGFSGFRIPARIQGEEELDSFSQKLSSGSSASYH